MGTGGPELLEVDGLCCGYAGRTVASEISFSLDRGEVMCLLGPNGVGKTTLFKTILRLVPLRHGRVSIHGQDVASWPAGRFAAKVGYVPQAHVPPFPFTVRDVVVMGRVSRLGPFHPPSAGDAAMAHQSLERLGVSRLAAKAYTEISGGERQLVLIARALAQEPEILVMDEPTSSLDYGNQLAVLEHVRALARQSGLGVLMTTHDPNHALLYGTKAAAMGRGGAFAVGRPRDVVTPEYLRQTYGIDVGMIALTGPGGDRLSACLPLAWGQPAGAGRPDVGGDRS